MDADWSDMHADIVDQIAVNLITFDDLLAFSVVCHSWYSAFMRAKRVWRPRMPWLMLPENAEDNPAGCRLRFFDPSTSKCYRLKLPKTLLCWGSAYGWIVGMELYFNAFMFNPLTGARVELPSTYELLGALAPPRRVYEDGSESEFVELCCRVMIEKIILLKIPSRSNKGEEVEEFLAVSFTGRYSVHINIAKPNDSRWTSIMIEGNRRGRIWDVAYMNDGLLLLDHEGAIYRVELNHEGAIHSKPLIATYYYPPLGAVLNDPPSDKLYLTESSGKLLVIWRFSYLKTEAVSTFEANDPVNDTHGFSVLKFNDEAEVWEHLKDLDDDAIFVGSNFTMAVRPCEIISCRRNCISFTDDLWPYWYPSKEFARHGMGVFDFDDSSGNDRLSSMFEPLYHMKCSSGRFCTPLWFFVPKF